MLHFWLYVLTKIFTKNYILIIKYLKNDVFMIVISNGNLRDRSNKHSDLIAVSSATDLVT